jgi:hypothetical protein
MKSDIFSFEEMKFVVANVPSAGKCGNANNHKRKLALEPCSESVREDSSLMAEPVRTESFANPEQRIETTLGASSDRSLLTVPISELCQVRKL